jgi:hypothetical protein
VTLAELFNDLVTYEISWDGGITWVGMLPYLDLDKLRPTHVRVRIADMCMTKPWLAVPQVPELPGIDPRSYQ